MIAMFILGISLLLSTLQLLKSKDLPDRVVSLDLISVIFMGIIIAFVFLTGRTIYLDVVLAFILIVFLGTVVISGYLKKKHYDS